MRKALIAVVLLTMTVFATAGPALAASPPPIQPPAQMADYAAWPAWAHVYLTDVVEWQIMQGYPDGSMQPQGNITRAEFTAMLARAMGNAQPDPTQTAAVTFSDVASTDWFYPTVQILAAAGVLPPGGQTFNPNQPITRYDAAVWMGRALGTFGVKGHGKAPAFPDVSSSSPDYPDFANTYEAAIITGYPDGTFKPAGAITRAEAAAMITRFLQDLPGYEQLQLQTPYLPALMTTPNQSQPEANSKTTVPIITDADLGFTPASTQSTFDAEASATWGQVHLWLATWNWLALGEAKLTSDQASYVASYGLEPWEVAELEMVNATYFPSLSGTYLGSDLWDGYPPGNSSAFEPVSSLFLQNPDKPWIGLMGWSAPEVTLIAAGTWGTAPCWVNVDQPRTSSGQVITNGLWHVPSIQTLTEKAYLSGGQLIIQW
ncbi:MAG: S-layer homology domain-containing protein [Peptococcaceae bacterium]|nr:S-layer homology domain-containing protein [Peptococcaceae bacterium]